MKINFWIDLVLVIVSAVIGFGVGDQRARYAIAADCHEFGGAKLMSGVVIECKVEVLKP